MQDQDNSLRRHDSTNTPYTQFSSGGSVPSLRHSSLGIASFILGILSGMAMFCLFAVAVLIMVETPDASEESPEMILLGFGMFFALAIAVIGSGLGIAGICQSNRKKIFAILGTIFSLVPAIVIFLTMLAGMLAD